MPQTFLHLLPHDVLYELFLLCVTTSPDPWLPVVLSQVCQSWRYAALASPTLWTTVSFRMSHPQQIHREPQAFLERSRGLPIDMLIYFDRHPADRVGRLVSSNAHRLRSLTLTSAAGGLVLDSVGFFARMPFPLMSLFRAVVPGEMDFHIIRSPDPACPFFAPYPTPPDLDVPIHRHFLWFSWNVRNLTTLSLMGLAPFERPSMEHTWSILSGCSGTLRHFDFEGWAPSTNDPPRNFPPITFPMLRSLRLGYLDDISSLVAFIVAPCLHVLSFYNALLCPTTRLYQETTLITQCDLSRVFRTLAPSCTRLTMMTLFGLDVCARDAVDVLFSTISEATGLMLLSCHPSITDGLFQPEARYRIPKVVLPKLRYLSITSTCPIDLARFLLRHKTVATSPLKLLQISRKQCHAASARPGIRSILAVVLDLNVKEGMCVSLLDRPSEILRSYHANLLATGS
ncbi:hypothetical protein B0H15DRAFT_349668 [Mycena belliarum]|uniref:F-box domain-containing protein n=1 Tax=Mycena belliarum TaxID=1033014 RepID=A0AAD6XTN8_9AGAR|nr:hypothetical protein B0H15DRAFT_349668 [Mycena belliae]